MSEHYYSAEECKLDDLVALTERTLDAKYIALAARHFGKPVFDAVCAAWLGSSYRMTPQLNALRPGGKAQDPHCDMPIESGSSKLPPFLQMYGAGLMSYRREGVRACFEANHVQAQLKKSDAVFFSPASYHVAGDNLDLDPPTGGLAPLTQAAPFRRALREGWTPATFNKALHAQDARRHA